MRSLKVHRLGRLEYADALVVMDEARAMVGGRIPPDTDRLLVVEHPPVITLGRSADAHHVLASAEWLRRNGFAVHAVDRGGDVTYHGPGQIVAYPVIELSGAYDVRRHVWTLEEAMIRTTAAYGVSAGRKGGHRGAWVGDRKIGAVGVRAERRVTTHGCAYNFDPDLRHFEAIVPCGIRAPGLGVTSLARELRERGAPVPPAADVEERFVSLLVALLGAGRSPE